MRDDGRRRQGFSSIGQEQTSQGLQNQLLNTATAENRQDAEGTAQKIRDINTITESAGSIFNSVRSIDRTRKSNALNSQKLSNQNANLDWQNKVAQGGLIDQARVSETEKLVLKREAGKEYIASLKANKKALEKDSGFLTSVLGNEASYNNAIAEFDLEIEEKQGEIDRQNENEFKKYNQKQTVSEIQNTISRIGSANKQSEIDTITDIVQKDILDAVSQNLLSETDAEVLINKTLSDADDRKLDVFINNLNDELFAGGNIEEIRSVAVEQYEALRNQEILQNSNKQIENETKLRNLILQYNKAYQDEAVTSTVASSINPFDNLTDNIKRLEQQPAYKEASIQEQARMQNEITKQDEEFLQSPADWINKYQGFQEPWERQQFLRQNNAGFLPATTKDEQKIMLRPFEQIGTQESDLTFTEQFDQVIADVSDLFFKGSQESLLKELKLSSKDSLVPLALELSIQGKNEEVTELMNALTEKNKNGGKLPTGKKILSSEQERAIKNDYYTTKRGQYEYFTDFTNSEKEANTFTQLSNFEDSAKIDDVIKKYDTFDYLVSDKKAIKYDAEEYSGTALNSGLTKIFRNPEKYNKFLREIDSIQAKQLRGKFSKGEAENLRAFSVGDNVVIKQDLGNGKEFALYEISFEDLENLANIPLPKGKYNPTTVEDIAKKTFDLPDRENIDTSNPFSAF